MNTKSTELNNSFEMRDNEQFTKSFYRGFIFAVAVAVICMLGIVFTALNAELIDGLEPEVQLIIVAVSFGTFGLVRFIIWIRTFI